MYSTTRIINGTFGKLYEDGVLTAECTAFQVKVTKTFEQKNQSGSMVEDRKLLSVKITGSMTVDKVFTRHSDDMEQAIAGHDVRHLLVGSLEDPDAYGAERVAVSGVSYDEQTVMDFALAKTGTVTTPFQATGIKYLDKVVAQG